MVTKLRDDTRRNNRGRFATQHADGEQVGVTVLGEADGCWTEYYFPCFSEAKWLGSEWRKIGECSFSETHEPGSHVLDDLIPIHGEPL